MNFYYTIQRYLLLMAVATTTFGGQSQENGWTPSALEVMKQTRLWQMSDNAAGLAWDVPSAYSSLFASYSKQHGNCHRPQYGDDAAEVNVYAEGFTDIGHTYLWGDFRYSHTAIEDARFNASLGDPYRGQPFYVTDEHTSDWLKKAYRLSFKAATHPFGHAALGLEGIYEASLSAKQRDPRVDARFLTLGGKPALSVSLSNRDVLGANMEYALIREESSMSREIYYVDHNYYEMYGLGNAVKGLGGERSTNYFGNRWGAGIQYGHHETTWSALSQLVWSRQVENVEIGYSTPEKEGLVDLQSFQASVSWLLRGTEYLHEAVTELNWQYNKATQYFSQRDNSVTNAGWNVIFKNVRAKYRSGDASVRYLLSRREGQEYRWQVEAQVTYRLTDDVFLLPRTTMDSKNLLTCVSFKRNFSLSGLPLRRLLASVHTGFRHSFGGGYSYGGSQPDLYPVSTIMPLESAYLTQDVWQMGGEVTFSQPVRRNSKTHVWVKGSFDYQQGENQLFNHWNRWSVTLGTNF